MIQSSSYSKQSGDYSNSHAEDLFFRLREVVRLIQPGMRRAEVEQLLNQPDGGIQGIPVTIYHFARGVKVEVPYVCQSWNDRGENRVSGPAQLFITVPQ